MLTSEINIGDHLILNSKPPFWSSQLCAYSTNYIPAYPCVVKILEMRRQDNHVAGRIRIDGREYGADLDSLCEVATKLDTPVGFYLRVLESRVAPERLTVGKTYKVLEITDDCHRIKDDRNHDIYLSISRLENFEIEYVISDDFKVPEPSPIREKVPVQLYKNHEEIKLPIRKKIGKPLTHIQEQLVKILLYQPEDLRSFVSHTTNPAYCVNFINKLIPSRVGYEFDTCGYPTIPTSFIDVLNETQRSKKHLKNRLSSSNSIFMHHIDNMNGHLALSENREIRFSFNNITGFKKLKLLLHEMVQNGIKPAENGGLHIHINLAPVITTSWVSYDKIDELRQRTKILYKYRGYIYNVFGIDKSESHIRDKSKFLKHGGDRGRISVLKGHDTIEWRLSNTTFDYTQIMKWTIFCHLMTELVKYPNKKFNMDLYENIRYVA